MTTDKGLKKLTADDFRKHKEGEWEAYVLDSCTSTFAVAGEKAAQGASHGTLIIANTQTGGKGRQGRKWISPEGGIWMCVILRPQIDIQKLSSVTLLCAAAVAKAIEELYPQVSLGIKWPNDIYINSKKVCGILTESAYGKEGTVVTAGIGINANNTTEAFADDIRQSSISFSELGIYVDRARLASRINDRLLQMIKKYEHTGDLGFALDYYISKMVWIGSECVMTNTGTKRIAKQGIVKGIDKEGRLLMDVGGKTEKIVSGELSLRRI